MKKSGRVKKNDDLETICNRMTEIGIRKSIVDQYRKENPDADLSGELDEYWIELFLGMLYWEKQENASSFENLLYDVGFKRRIAKRLWKDIVEPVFNTCYTYEQLFDIVLEYLWGKTTPLFENKPYFIDLPQENAWHYDMEMKCLMLNYDRTIEIQDVVKLLNNHQNKNQVANENAFYLFHGTSWKSAVSILQEGISHSVGRRCLDFGNGSGFYMTKSLNMALDWGKKRQKAWGNEVAIIILRLHNDDLKGFKKKTFSHPTTEWETLVKSSRQCKTIRNALDFFDFVYGPVCSNPKDVSKSNAKPLAFPNMFQLVSKSERGDILIRENLLGCIWLKNTVNKKDETSSS